MHDALSVLRSQEPPAARVAGEVDTQHLVQFYQDEAFLFDAVASFLAEGLRAAQPVLVIATEAHQRGFAEALRLQGWNVEREIDKGLLSMLDARRLLDELVVDGQVDVLRFRQLVGSALKQLQTGAAGMPARAYGEMVNLLWEEGKSQLALTIEEHWNALAELHSFSLLCAYHMGNFPDHPRSEAFSRVCSRHSHVLPAERYAQHQDDGVRLRQISELQQRALALESEIEQRKKTESALRDALRLRDEFLTIAGHELRTPLTALSLQMQNLTSIVAGRDDAETVECVARSRAQVKRLRGLVEQLLDVTSMRAGRLSLEREHMSLVGAVRDVVEGLSAAAARAGCRVMVLASGEVSGSWDPTRIDQVITNLLSNAIKYGAGRPIEVRVRERDGRALLAIEDHGIGIPLQDQTRIFGRFERAVSTRTFGGFGLGLWIVQQIVDAHGGTVSVESQVGHGSTFSVLLPLHG